MGCFWSCTSSAPIRGVRVVHFNGYVEDFEQPVTVAQVTGKPPNHLVCTRAQLLSGGLMPLKPDTDLQLGTVYFLLPFSTFRSEVSPADLASMARKLTQAAKARPTQINSTSSPHGSSPRSSSPVRSPSQCTQVEPDQGGVAAYALPRASKVRPWKPILDTIREKSFNRASESDLQEKNREAQK